MNINRLFCLEVRIPKRRSIVEARACMYVTLFTEKPYGEEEN